MKFLCLECDAVMSFAERQIPGDGTLAAVFECGSCGREMAMLTNPMETQLVSGMGVKIGGRTVPEQPMEITRTTLDEARDDAFVPAGHEPTAGNAPGATGKDPEDSSASAEASGPSEGSGAGTSDGRIRVRWTPDALDRLQRVPRFVRGMVKRI
ncbi:MAG: hypothetical protein R3223_12730, partial [Longimicrobiales bacterium]|nr:hypothetical protein [Longimicrobiales bacterium]